MIKNIVTLVLNDLAVSFKNKSIYLVLFVPLFVVFSLKMTDRPDAAPQKFRIGLIQNETYPPEVMKSMIAGDGTFSISRVSLAQGTQQLKARKLDGVLARSSRGTPGLALLVMRKESLLTLSIVESFSALQKTAAGIRYNWITEIEPLEAGGAQRQMTPAWVLMLVLLPSLILLPAQVAEEKEKNLLAGLLQTPMRETEWLAAKLVSGLLLINVAVLALHLPTGLEPLQRPAYVIFLEAGSFCFLAFGILLGLLCRTQASARTLGVLFYLIFLVPPALSDLSTKLSSLASFIPSYQLYGPLKSILLENSGMSGSAREGMFLLVFGTIAFLSSRVLIKRRWLM